MSTRINKTENELLCDILKKWGVKDPDDLIQKCIDNDHIKCNDHGAITILILKDCNLNGTIPSSLGGLLKSLEILDLSCNQLTGSLPSSLGTLLKLQKLILKSNVLSGPIPESFGALNNLERLDLEYNTDMSGSLPGLGNMVELFLKGTKISMYKLDPNERKILCNALKHWGYDSAEQIIDELIRENNIRYNDLGIYELIIRERNLIGQIPDEIGELIKLEKLDLRGNHINGKIPESIGKLKDLKLLDISLNELDGIIPATLGSLTKLKKLDLHSNQLNGHLPPQVGHLSELTELILCDNKLTGWIPDSLSHCICLQHIDLKNNLLSGPIPESIAKLARLSILDLENNADMDGSMPAMRSVDCTVKIIGTSINAVTIKTKDLNGMQDYIGIVIHVLLGYVDLATDILSLYTFYNLNNTNLFALNLAFIVYSLLLAVATAWPKPIAMLYNFFQISALIEGINTLRTGHQTDGLQQSKKVDAIVRAVPSMIIQLFSILITIEDLSETTLARLFASVIMGLAGASFTLAQLAANSGDSMFSIYFLFNFFYFVSELTFRVVVITLMFVSVKYYAIIACGIDMIVRYVTIQIIFGNENKYFDILVMSTLSFASDYQVAGHGRICVFIGLIIQIIEAIIFLVILYVYDDDEGDLKTLYDEGYAMVLVIVVCVSCAIRAMIMASGILEVIIDAPVIPVDKEINTYMLTDDTFKQEEVELI